MLKVVYILNSTTLYGGANKSFYSMLTLLQTYGVEPLVVVPDKKGIYNILKEKNITIKDINFRPALYPSIKNIKDLLLWFPRVVARIGLNCIAIKKLTKICRDFQPQIIHTNVGVVDIGYKVTRILHIPHIWHIREYGLLDFNYHYIPNHQIYAKRYKENNSFTICITKDIQRYNHLEENDTSKVIYNGVIDADTSCFEPDKSSFFLYAGRIEKAKGVMELIEAYADYCKKSTNPLSLTLSGSVTNKEYYEMILDKTDKYGIKQNIRFLGECKDMDSLYQRATAVIIPSVYEGFGRVAVEAMNNGCLVIGKNTGGSKEQFDNGKEITGKEIALRYTTTKQLTKQLLYASQISAEEYSLVVKNSQLVINQLYTKQQNAREIFNFYSNIMK